MNDRLVQVGELDNEIFYVVKGGLRKYSLMDHREITLDFFFEDEVVFPKNSHPESHTDYFLEAIEETQIYQISLANFNRVKDISPRMSQLEIKVLELAHEQALNRLEEFQSLNATERYLKLFERSPKIIKNVKLKHIASYLGINNASLSKIRAGLK